jgi:2-dehydropantoate 2-reductase
MRILMLGAGGTGGYFGGRLAEAGMDVSFLVRPARAAHLAAHGLVVRSPCGDIAIPVKAVTADRLDSIHDVIILSCKAYDLDDAIRAIHPAVGPATIVLPLLNGLRHLARLDEAFGAEGVIGGFCHIGVTLGAAGDIQHLNALHTLTFGERSHERSARCDAIADVLRRARFDTVLSADILQDMWEKFVMLTALAAATCLMRASVGDILAASEGEAIMLAMLEECRAVAAATGHPPRDAFLAGTRTLLTTRGAATTASMLRDIERGGRIEAEHIVGDMLSRAGALGLAAPLLRVAFCHLQAYEAGQSRRRNP